MRGITEAEAQVLRALLASEPVPEVERVSRTGIPPRTFRAARGRIYQEGWVVDRYLPDPALLGIPYLSFVVAEPFMERREEVQRRWSGEPSALVVWSCPQTFFGVFARRKALGPGARPPDYLDPQAFRRCFELTVATHERSLPVYFDFEGAWDHLMGSRGMIAYPHAWKGSSLAEGNGGHERLLPKVRPAVEGLVRRPFEVEQRGGNPAAIGPFFLPRSQQRAMDEGWVSRRIFLNPSPLPAFNGRRIERLILLRGGLVPGRRPDHLLQRLIERCRVLPFLFASNGEHVLLGAVSVNPPPPGPERASVSGVLGLFLQGIEVLREPTETLMPLVNHRYDRLLDLP